MRMNALWWWIDRWRKSSAYMDMTLEQQGAYRNLLDEATLRGGFLPNDERILAKACGDALAWAAIRTVVMARFELGADGWRNKTLDDVLAESQKRSEKQRRYRNGQGNGSGNGISNAPSFGNGVGNEPGNETRPPDPDPDLISGSESPSPVLSPRAPLALAGTLPREHLRHGWCSSRGKCVPDFLHEEFIRSVGGDRRAADQRLRAFYEAREHGWPEGPIGDDPVKLWRREFAASFPSVAPVRSGNGLSNVTSAALRAIEEAQ